MQRDILAVSRSEPPFDIFICYKDSDEHGDRTKDSTLAQEIYYELNELGFRVFFSRITLEDKPGVQYEPYIFAALNSAKVMIVVGTKPEYMNAVWVKNEWSRFLALMRKDRSKLLIPCYRDMEVCDLPEQISVLQAYDMEKIGFLQDLVRGVTKILGKQTEEHAPAPTVAPTPDVQPDVAALLDRGQKALEAGSWQDADAFFERALDHDPTCAQAYMGEFLAVQHAASFEQFLQSTLQEAREAEAEQLEAVEEDEDRLQNAISHYTATKLIKAGEIKATYRFDRTYSSVAAKRTELRDKTIDLLSTNRLFKRARQFAKGPYLEAIENARLMFLDQLHQLLEDARDEDAKAISAIREDYAKHLTTADAAVERAYLKRKKKRRRKSVIFFIVIILILIALWQVSPSLTGFTIVLLIVFGKPLYQKLI